MIFKGIGLVWNPSKGKAICNFKNGEYETDNLYEIGILEKCPQAEYVSGEKPEAKEVKEAKKTRKELIAEAKEKGIKNPERVYAVSGPLTKIFKQWI